MQILSCLPPASEGRGKIIFSLCVSVHTSTRGGVPCPPERGGGVPHPRSRMEEGYPHLKSRTGGTPSQVQDGGYPYLGSRMGGYPYLGSRKGYPISGQGGMPSQDRGYPIPGQDWGLHPCQDWMEVPNSPIRTGWGTPPPPGSGDGETEQLRGGRYTSCAHAGELSFLTLFCICHKCQRRRLGS